MVDASETPLRLGVRRATAQSHSSAMPVPYRFFCLLTTRRTGRTLFTLSLIPFPCWRPSARCTVALPEGQRRARSAAASANPPPVGTRRHVAVAHVLDFDIFTRIAERMGCRVAFDEGRTEMDHLRPMYDRARERAATGGSLGRIWMGSGQGEYWWRKARWSRLTNSPHRHRR